MCGICGSIYYTKESQNIVEECIEIRDQMHERGPHGEGIWFEEKHMVAFGHKRLAIIDPKESSNQPMKDDITGNVIVYNGEIYNYKYLREELKNKGHVFKTDSDTEVVLILYREYGISFISKLKGIFAFAIWNEKENYIVLARDPLGIKPLYYASSNKSFNLNKFIGMGYLKKESVNDKLKSNMELVSLPFVEQKYYKK